MRENRDGILYSLVYDKVIARHVDPVEKKPLFHFKPNSLTYSFATPGCNFRCKHCQNADISQFPLQGSQPLPGNPVSPSEIVHAALENNCTSISYTYTEPTIFFELAYDTARLAVEAGLANIFVTNGYLTPVALKTITPYLHAANIDLKSFSDDFYRTVCGARLAPVLEAIQEYKNTGIWIELTTLLIPGYNDSTDELRKMAGFIASIGKEIPWHLSRFYPRYLLKNEPTTPIETISRARQIGLDAGLRYVYEGNIPGQGEDTICWNCRKTIVKRFGYQVLQQTMKENRCSFCNAAIDGIW